MPAQSRCELHRLLCIPRTFEVQCSQRFFEGTDRFLLLVVAGDERSLLLANLICIKALFLVFHARFRLLGLRDRFCIKALFGIQRSLFIGKPKPL
jgi:hypothetical protein